MPIRRIRPAPTALGDLGAPSNPGASPEIDESDPLPAFAPPSEQGVSRQRGHARKNEAGRFEPAGEYEVGFARPPPQHRFKPGNRGGPGRPKTSVSHDTILRRELKQKRPVRIDGRTINLTTRELLLKTILKDALEGDKAARRLIFAEAARLFPDEGHSLHGPSMAELNESDQRSLADLKNLLLEGYFDDVEKSSEDSGAAGAG